MDCAGYCRISQRLCYDSTASAQSNLRFLRTVSQCFLEEHVPGKYWFSNFMQRNPLLSVRTREGQHWTQVFDDFNKTCSELVSEFGFTPTKMRSLWKAILECVLRQHGTKPQVLVILQNFSVHVLLRTTGMVFQCFSFRRQQASKSAHCWYLILCWMFIHCFGLRPLPELYPLVNLCPLVEL